MLDKINHAPSPTAYTPSLTFAQCATSKKSQCVQTCTGTARFDMVYPVQMLGNIQTKHDVSHTDDPHKHPPASPSLGPNSPRVTCTPLGIPGGGALGPQARLISTIPNLTNRTITFSLRSVKKNKVQPSIDSAGSSGNSSFTRKPLAMRVKDFCQELGEVRASESQTLNSSN